MYYFDVKNKLGPSSQHRALSAGRIALFYSAHCAFLKVSNNNLLGIVVYAEQYAAIPTKTKAIKSTNTWLLENARFPKFRLSFVSSQTAQTYC